MLFGDWKKTFETIVVESETEYDGRRAYVVNLAHAKAPIIVEVQGDDAAPRQGEITSIVGQSGSGKSTMMNVLGCLDRLTEGQYYIDGNDVSGLDDDELSEMRLRYIGFIFQMFNLVPYLSVVENVTLPCRFSNKRRRSVQAGNMKPQVRPGEIEWLFELDLPWSSHGLVYKCIGPIIINEYLVDRIKFQ